jgi:hypothetical protein
MIKYNEDTMLLLRHSYMFQGISLHMFKCYGVSMQPNALGIQAMGFALYWRSFSKIVSIKKTVKVTPSIGHQGLARRSMLLASQRALQKQQSDES